MCDLRLYAETLRRLCRKRMFRSRTESHRTAGGPDGLEHFRDFRVHGQIKPQGEEAGKFRPSMLHHHSPRASLRITGIDQPRSVAVEDRKHCIKHIAHHLLEVVRPLDGSVNLIHALQEPEMTLALLFCPLAFNRDSCKVASSSSMSSSSLRRRTSRFAIVHRRRFPGPFLPKRVPDSTKTLAAHALMLKHDAPALAHSGSVAMSETITGDPAICRRPARAGTQVQLADFRSVCVHPLGRLGPATESK